MKVVGVLIFGVCVIVGSILLLRDTPIPTLAITASVADSVPTARVEIPQSIGTESSYDTELYTIHGTAVLDYSSGIPAVPFIRYMDESNRVATKQLTFLDARGCAPGAGDLPCVPGYSGSSGYPKISDGEAITVTGYFYENRFVLTSLES